MYKMNIQKSLQKIVKERERRKEKFMKVRNLLSFATIFFLGIFIGSFFLQNNFSITGFASGALPTVGGDSGNWGTILNNYLSQEHTTDGSHGNVTAESLNVSGLIRANNWSNVSITESQISGLHVWNATNTSYRTLDNLTFNGNTNISGNLNVTGNVTISGDVGSGTPEANTLYAKSLPKAWVNFDGTTCSGTSGSCMSGSCTIGDSFNVECVNRTGTGNYTIYWDRDFANANYVPSITNSQDLLVSSTDDIFMIIKTMSTGTLGLRSVAKTSGSFIDTELITVVAFGEQ